LYHLFFLWLNETIDFIYGGRRKNATAWIWCYYTWYAYVWYVRSIFCQPRVYLNLPLRHLTDAYCLYLYTFVYIYIYISGAIKCVLQIKRGRVSGVWGMWRCLDVYDNLNQTVNEHYGVRFGRWWFVACYDFLQYICKRYVLFSLLI
jgi:hypothetical protein